MEIDATTLNQLFSALTVLILAIIALLNKQRTDSAATTAAATTATAATNAAIAATEKTAVQNIAAATTIPTPTTTPTSTIYDITQWGGVSPAYIPWEITRQRVLFRVSDETKKNLLSGVTSPSDIQKILDSIAEAEKTNEYHYTIGYSAGYYEMQAVAEPISATQYKYYVVAKASGMQKQT